MTWLLPLLLTAAPCTSNADCGEGLCDAGACLSTAPAPAAPAWEDRRVHAGFGLRTHGGAMFQRDTTFLLAETELFGALDVRLFGATSLRVQLGFAAGWPNSVAGETNVSLRFALGERLTLGVGVFGAWSLYAMRGGVEVPLTLRFGRRHELTFALRASPGVYDNVTFYWYDLRKQFFALSLDAAVGYAFFF